MTNSDKPFVPADAANFKAPDFATPPQRETELTDEERLWQGLEKVRPLVKIVDFSEQRRDNRAVRSAEGNIEELYKFFDNPEHKHERMREIIEMGLSIERMLKGKKIPDEKVYFDGVALKNFSTSYFFSYFDEFNTNTEALTELDRWVDPDANGPQELEDYLDAGLVSIKSFKMGDNHLSHINSFLKKTQKLLELPEYEKCRKKWSDLVVALNDEEEVDNLARAMSDDIVDADPASEADEERLDEFEKAYGKGAMNALLYSRGPRELKPKIIEIQFLEKFRPGITKYLFENYGIVDYDPNAFHSQVYDFIKRFDDNLPPLSTEYLDSLKNEPKRLEDEVRFLLNSGSLKTVNLVVKYVAENFKMVTSGRGLLESFTTYPEKSGDTPQTILFESEILEALEKKVAPFVRSDGKSFFPSVRDALSVSGAVQALVAPYGLEAKKLIESWFSRCRDGHQPLTSNLEAIKQLELIEPGAAKVLFEDFGIRNFDRYPAELLTEQYRTRQDSEKSYGVIINPTEDYNTAFYGNFDLWLELSEKLKQLGYNFRVVEVASKIELAKRLLSLTSEPAEPDQKKSIKHKISFAIIGGHGQAGSISFGGADEKQKLLLKDLLGAGVKRSVQFFEDQPTIILNSCSTGSREGIAQEISKLSGGTVFGPDRPAALKSIEVTPDQGRLQFKVEYYDNAAAGYNAGAPLEHNKTEE